jgi:hypothetical protein
LTEGHRDLRDIPDERRDLGTRRTYVMQGAVHLVLFAAYLFLAVVP